MRDQTPNSKHFLTTKSGHEVRFLLATWHQPRYNLFFRHIEAELFPLVIDQGVGVISYNPLAGGILTGRYKAGEAPEAGTCFTLHNTRKMYQSGYWQDLRMQAIEKLKTHCPERSLALAQVALAWVLGSASNHIRHSGREQTRAA